MTPYLALYSFYFLIFIFELFLRRVFSFSICFILLLPLVIFGGIREEIGADWDRYFDTFYIMEHLSFFNSFLVRDIAYGGLNWISYHLIFPDFSVFNTLVSAITVYSFALFASNLGQRYFWFLICAFIPYHFLIVSFGFVRQSLALSTLFIFLYLMERRNNKRASIALWFGLLFHKSLALMGVIVALSRGLSLRTIIIFFVPMFIFVVIYREFIFQRLIGYSEGSFSSVGVLFRASLTLLAGSALLFRPKIFSDLSAYRNISWWLFLFSLFNCVLAIKFSTIADRLMVYTIIFIYPFIVGFEVVLAPMLRIQYRILVLLIIFLFLAAWLFLANNAGSWVPFETIF